MTRGGKRPGAGRPKTGRREYSVRVKPAAWSKFKSAAQAEQLTPGQKIEKLTEEL